MVGYLYSTASCATDYQDAALLCLLWYLFGCASDLTFVRKQQLSIGAGDVFFIRFIRMKTSDEQALSLFPDDDCRSCPLLTLALALITQESPCTALLSHLPVQAKGVPVDLVASIPLLELLEDPVSQSSTNQDTKPSQAGASSALGIHALVKRLLLRVAAPSGVEEQLTSHSFRRGGAQHANACSDLTAQWIFDRGAWNLTTTNKAFAYVFNTPKEDHQVAKVLSGMAPKQPTALPFLDIFDSTTRERIHDVSKKLFNASHGLTNKTFNVSQEVRSVLTATLIRHYPLLSQMNPHGPAVTLIKHCVEASQLSMTDLLSWSQHITNSTSQHHSTTQDLKSEHEKSEAAFKHQAALIERLIKVNRSLEDRISALEKASSNNQNNTDARTNGQGSKREREAEASEPVKRRRRPKMTPLTDTWFAWYTQTPRGWFSKDKHKKSDSKLLVAFMRLFIPDGYVLDEAAPNYKEAVRNTGEIAAQGLHTYFQEQGISSAGTHSVLKHLRALHRIGELDKHITAYNQRVAIGRVLDPAPEHLQTTLKPST